MNICNSSYGVNQDDTDMTMINHSFIYRPNDEPIGSCILAARRLQQTNINNESNNLTSLGPFESLEMILRWYYQDLGQKTMTNFHCDQQLITRLIDSLRPAYSPDDYHIKELDQLYNDIINLQKNRFSQQKEQQEQLCAEIHDLKISIVTQTIENNEREFQRMNTIIDYEQWMEIEQETRELQQLIESQNKQIQILIETLSSQHENQTQLLVDHSILPAKQDEFPIPLINNQIEIQPPPFEPTAPRIPRDDEHFHCPYCDEQLTCQDEITYLEHVSQCFNEMNNIF